MNCFNNRLLIEIIKTNNKVEKFLLPTQKQQFDTICAYLHSCFDADDHLATSSNAFIYFILGLSSHENAAQIIDHKMQKETNVFLTTISLRDLEV